MFAKPISACSALRSRTESERRQLCQEEDNPHLPSGYICVELRTTDDCGTRAVPGMTQALQLHGAPGAPGKRSRQWEQTMQGPSSMWPAPLTGAILTLK